MKPISVRFRCFGPYIEVQTIPFDRLAGYGLFLICGETGSGKTTILDAMCCALYGSCSGDIRGELEAMRCKQAGPGDPTEVEFVFETEGRRSCFRRKLTPRRKHKRGKEDGLKEESAREAGFQEESFNEDLSCCVLEAGSWVPLMDNCKKRSMNAKAAELIGLDLNQFRQVIILPQGKFETLLTSGSEDKESILSSLFHTERWKTAVERMAEELRARREEIDRESQTLQEGLKRLGIPSVAELPQAITQARAEAENAGKAEAAAKEQKERARKRLELSREYLELDRRQQRLDAATRASEGDRGLQTRLEMAGRAEKARRPHDEWAQATAELKKAEERLRQTEEKRAAAAEELRRAEAEKNGHAASAPEQEAREKEAGRLAEIRNRYLEIEQLQRQADAAKKTMEKAGGRLAGAGEAAGQEMEGLRRLEGAWNDVQNEYERLSRAYRAAAVGHLAATLEEGEACPVCGSRVHPAPAALPEDAVTAVAVEEAEGRLKKARVAFENQKGLQRKAEEARREEEKAYQEVKGAWDKADGALANGLALRDPALPTLRALDRRMAALENQLREYNEKKTGLEEAFTRISKVHDGLVTLAEERRGQQRELEAKTKEKAEAWKKALEETGLGTETQYSAMILSAEGQSRIRTTLSDHAAARESARKAVGEQQEKLRGTERPDTGTAEAAWQEAEARYSAAISARTLAEEKRNQTERDAEKLTALDSRLSEKRRTYDGDAEFVRALRGSVGKSLQRYVLGVRLGQVIAEANGLLAGIYGGRYRLHRSDESHGAAHKSGLELEVYDHTNDRHRSVCTLSGGEKFLVALSLAIGLRTVVQNEQKGVSLEAMFIDEGFGSLDQSALGDALDILQGVQRGRGLVGIISHVQLLEENIPTKIITKKTAFGSVTALQL